MNKNLMPPLSPPVARTIPTQSAHPEAPRGVAPSSNLDFECRAECGTDQQCYHRCWEAGALVDSFPSVKFVGYSSRPSHRRW